MSREPDATYRVQLGADLDFAATAGLAGYLRALGASDLYLSPAFSANPGSAHGYDVTDPTRLSPELGGEEGFHGLVEALQGERLSILLDVVPNHMAASTHNRFWLDVLREGRSSRYAPVFDIDWEAADERGITLPILGREPQEAVEAGELVLERSPDGPRIRYYETVLPAQAADGEPLESVLEHQPYRLVYWRDAGERITYRRFFDISDLVAVRVEDPAIFTLTQELACALVERGCVRGLRVDHVDGLADPAGYLEALRRRLPDAYVVVEKILATGEALPDAWPVDGTTGYEFLNGLTRLLVDSDGVALLRDEYRRSTGAPAWERVVAESRELVLGTLFPGDFRRLAERLEPAGEALLREATLALPVYRTYARGGETPAELEPVRPHLRADESWERFVIEWQRLTGPLAAKGIEDTALYRWHALVALNEVGGDPDPAAASLGVGAFHAAMEERARRWPASLSASSTHDTKRSEDVRARLCALSELGEEWTAALVAMGDDLRARRRTVGGVAVPEPHVERLLLQTVLGVWPLSDGEREGLPERLERYLEKALREAKERTSWHDPDADYERAVTEVALTLLDEPPEALSRLAPDVALHGAQNALAQTLLKVAAPGVPDVYQGTELWDLSLADPDNRRPVDFAARRALLERDGEVGVEELVAAWPDGRIKLRVLARALAARRRRPALFRRGRYLPLAADDELGQHVVAFARERKGAWALAAAARLTLRLARGRLAVGEDVWRGAELELPAGAPSAWRCALSGERLEARGRMVSLAGVFAHLPVALLEPV